MDYPVVIIHLPEEEGGGYLCKAPDLHGCFSDGNTPEEAAANIQDAIYVWIDECKRIGRNVPEPGSAARRAQAEKNAIVAHLNQMISHYDALDSRIEEISANLAELMEQNENHGSWVRFSELTSLSLVGGIENTRKEYC